MNSKYKFGLTEVVVMIVGSLIIVLIDLLFGKYGIYYADFIKSVLIVFIAAVFGAPAGTIVAVASSFLQAAIFNLDLNVVNVTAFGLIALYIGHYASKYGILEDRFKGKLIFDFVIEKFFAEMCIWIFFAPLIYFLIKGDNLYDALNSNVLRILMLTLFDALLIPIFILLGKAFNASKK